MVHPPAHLPTPLTRLGYFAEKGGHDWMGGFRLGSEAIHTRLGQCELSASIEETLSNACGMFVFARLIT